MSPSATADASSGTSTDANLRLPVETDILITVGGDVIVADLPLELEALLVRLQGNAPPEVAETQENRLD